MVVCAEGNRYLLIVQEVMKVKGKMEGIEEEVGEKGHEGKRERRWTALSWSS